MNFMKPGFLALVVAAGVCAVVCFFVLIPITVINTLKFNSKRRTTVLKKRYAYITMHESFWTLCHLFLTSLCFFSTVMKYHQNLDDKYHSKPAILLSIPLYINIPTNVAFLWCWVWRLWMIFYEIKWTQATLSQQWQKLLDPTIGGYSWWTANRNRYGSGTVMGYNIYFLITISAAVWLYFCYFKCQYRIVTQGILYLIPYLAISAIAANLPPFDDNFSVRREIKKIFLPICAGFVLFIIEMSVCFTLHQYDLMVAYDFITLAMEMATNFTEFWVVYIATHWVLARFEPYFGFQKIEEIRHVKGTDTREKEARLIMVEDNSDDISLRTILSHPKGYDYFMKHLAREFSMECLASLTEFLQYQEYTNETSVSVGTEDDLLKYTLDNSVAQPLVLPSNVPDSHIIYRTGHNYFSLNNVSSRTHSVTVTRNTKQLQYSFVNISDASPVTTGGMTEQSSRTHTLTAMAVATDSIVRIKFIAYKLFRKYVCSNAMHQINISYRTRKALTDRMSDRRKWLRQSPIDLMDLLHLFDDACEEVYLLLSDSLRRFKDTPQYLPIQDLFNDK